jgi:hypothetical protein
MDFQSCLSKPWRAFPSDCNRKLKIAQVEKMTEIGNFELMEINNKESSAAVTATTQINV